MKDNIKIFAFYVSIIIILIIFGTKCNSQTIVNDKTFYQTKSGISIVEFWAEWNEINKCDWIVDIEDAESYRIDLDSQTAKDYDIKVLPTLIVFNNGDEIDRFEGNISFKLCPKRTPRKVQKVVDGLMTNKL